MYMYSNLSSYETKHIFYKKNLTTVEHSTDMLNNRIGRNCGDRLVGSKFVGGIILDRNHRVCNGNEYMYLTRFVCEVSQCIHAGLEIIDGLIIWHC